MPSFRRSGRNTLTPRGSPEPSEITCPFLARTIAASKTHICLSGEEPLAISRRYVDSYCVTTDHARCSLFLAAYRASEEVREPEPANGIVRVDALVDQRVDDDIAQPVDHRPGALPSDVLTSQVATETRPIVQSEEPSTNSAGSVIPSDREDGQVDVLVPAPDHKRVEANPAPSADSPQSERARIVAQAQSAANVTEHLVARVHEGATALVALTELVQQAESRDPSALAPQEALERLRSVPDDAALDTLILTTQTLSDKPDSLRAYMEVTRNAQTLVDIVDALRQFRTAESR